MEINMIASGSSGNCIVVSDGTSRLMLDAGLPYRRIATKVRCSELAGCLVSHAHGDHCKAVPELLRRGIDVYSSQETIDERGYKSAIPVKKLQQVNIGSWTVLPFDVEHDVPNLGFLFQSNVTGEKALYAVDMSFITYDFTGIHTWLIEANYDEKLLEEGPYDTYLKDRIRRSHYSLNNLKIFLGSSDLSGTQEIYLLHLSDANSNEHQFKEEIQQLTGVPTYTISDYQSKPHIT